MELIAKIFGPLVLIWIVLFIIHLFSSPSKLEAETDERTRNTFRPVEVRIQELENEIDKKNKKSSEDESYVLLRRLEVKGGRIIEAVKESKMITDDQKRHERLIGIVYGPMLEWTNDVVNTIENSVWDHWSSYFGDNSENAQMQLSPNARRKVQYYIEDRLKKLAHILSEIQNERAGNKQ